MESTTSTSIYFYKMDTETWEEIEIHIPETFHLTLDETISQLTQDKTLIIRTNPITYLSYYKDGERIEIEEIGDNDGTQDFSLWDNGIKITTLDLDF